MLKKKPHLVLWFIGAILAVGCCISYLFKIDTNFLLTIGDIYLVVAHSHIFLLGSLWFLLCGFGYFILHKYEIEPIYSLTKIHLGATLLSLLGIVVDQFTNNDGVESVIAWASILIFLVAQTIYFVNIAMATVLKVRVK
ncbi:hypothetical protein Celal_0967 [Cellulophaga algicola DSM 14237]|uniref:Uncharacterized protein n=1 Tax=Cellulophaga algicola (strain DSM 14237 / IC166 / ACAM 630) TaxID=688270 RepID=E6X4J2_CELAD|nr:MULTISPECIES: hypothetical protein [Cellulophaga]ADV48292.1 hypothetical protein Celal_0967 [Cellulophaga algicola DSM 14237]